jgi:hypothetical protein
MSFFSFTKLENRRVKQVLPGAGGVGTSGRGGGEENGHRRMNMVHVLCTHVCKWKNATMYPHPAQQ